MMRVNSKFRIFFSLIMIIFMVGLIFISQTVGEEKSDATRILISTSGPAKFSSHWLDNPPRIVVEFKSRNILSKINKEVIMDQGVIKKVTSSYFGRGENKPLRSLTFELLEKVPYKIWQEDNAILLDIQSSLETTEFSIGAEGKEVFVESEVSNVIERLEAMDTTLKQVTEDQRPLGNINTEVTNETQEEAERDKAESSQVISAGFLKEGQAIIILLWLTGLVLISGLGFLFWRRYSINKSNNMAEKVKGLKLQLQEKDKHIEQEETVRKIVEKTALEKEKEYEQLQLQLQEENKLFQQEKIMRKEKEKALQELGKEYGQLKETGETLKSVLVKRGIAKELTSPEGKEELWILGKSPERRNLPRLTLTKDFHNTVILKVELPGISKPIKSFAENIGTSGLCFQSSQEFNGNQCINLRLFFYGGKVPNFKTQGWIVWKKIQDAKNYYGITFEGLSEKVKSELQHYIEVNIPRG